MRLRNYLLALISIAMPLVALAGPVPGVETFDKKAVTFPVSPSTQVWDIGNDEYLVTFSWKSSAPLDKPGVAGAFNNWNRADLPMEGPDATGTYKVTARIKAGEYQYKFVSGNDGWHTDPGNPAGQDDNYGGRNSILRLGVFALIAGAKAERGDGKILWEGLSHDPRQSLYLDISAPGDALIRLRTLVNDVEGASIVLGRESGEMTTETMTHAASDAQYDYYEYHLVASEKDAKDPFTFYRLAVSDAKIAAFFAKSFPIDMDAKPTVNVPEWAKNAIWYQIMVERFRDGDPGNNPDKRGTETVKDYPPQTHPWRSEWYTELPYERLDGQTFWKWSMYNRIYGGDFQGVIDKLDYIKSLGATAIYFNPVFEAQGSHKYNARNYVHADDGYGKLGGYWPAAEKEDLLDSKTWIMTESDKKLVQLIAEAHKRDLRVVFDGVWNHVGDSHPAFLDVKSKGKASRFADWFDVKSWEPFEYSGWGGFGGLPEFKKTDSGLYSASLVTHINEVTRKWMDPNGDGDPSDGIDGWRLDVPMHIPRPYWVEWRKFVKSINPDAYITGEIWDPAEYWLDGETFDAVMNYQFSQAAFRFFGNKKQKTTAAQFDQELARLRIRYPRAINQVLMNLYDSHDTDRWVSRLLNPDLPYDAQNRLQDNGSSYNDKKPSADEYQRMRLMALFQATYIGAPMIWYGDEVGMFGADDPRSRMPMWWDDMMPYDSPDYTIDSGLRDFFRSAFKLRNSSEVLRTGDFLTLAADNDKDCFAYLRHSPACDEAFVIVLNNSGAEQRVTFPAPQGSVLPGGFNGAKLVFGEATMAQKPSREEMTVTVPAVSGVVLRLKK